MKTYTQDDIDACRAKVDADLRAYRTQVGKAPSREFESRFFDDQVLLLDYMFVHRLPGWPSSAVASLKLPPARSVLKLRVGDEVELTEADFVRLSEALFAELEERYA